MFRGFVVESGPNAPILPVCLNFSLLRKHEFDLPIFFVLTCDGHVFEVLGLGTLK